MQSHFCARLCTHVYPCYTPVSLSHVRTPCNLDTHVRECRKGAGGIPPMERSKAQLLPPLHWRRRRTPGPVGPAWTSRAEQSWPHSLNVFPPPVPTAGLPSRVSVFVHPWESSCGPCGSRAAGSRAPLAFAPPAAPSEILPSPAVGWRVRRGTERGRHLAEVIPGGSAVESGQEPRPSASQSRTLDNIFPHPS